LSSTPPQQRNIGADGTGTYQHTLTIPINKKTLSILMIAAAPGLQSYPSSHSANAIKTSNVQKRVKQYNIFVASQTHRAALSLRQRITDSSPDMEKTSDKFWSIPKALAVWIDGESLAL
jgi:hypothetical protein